MIRSLVFCFGNRNNKVVKYECNDVKIRRCYKCFKGERKGVYIFYFENCVRGPLGRDAPGAEVRLQYPRQHSTECGKIPHNTIISFEKK